jgi:hypothetical protein
MHISLTSKDSFCQKVTRRKEKTHSCFFMYKKDLSPLISNTQVLVAPDKDYILIVLQKTKKLGSEDQRE